MKLTPMVNILLGLIQPPHFCSVEARQWIRVEHFLAPVSQCLFWTFGFSVKMFIKLLLGCLYTFYKINLGDNFLIFILSHFKFFERGYLGLWTRRVPLPQQHLQRDPLHQRVEQRGRKLHRCRSKMWRQVVCMIFDVGNIFLRQAWLSGWDGWAWVPLR